MVAVILAPGSGAYAGSSGAGAISACVHHHGGGLYRASNCARHDGRLNWDVRGATGARGPTGAQGPKGNTGATGVPGPTEPAAVANPSGPSGIANFPADSAYHAVAAITIPARSSGTYLVEANGQLSTGSASVLDRDTVAQRSSWSCLDRHRERAFVACPCQGRKQTSRRGRVSSNSSGRPPPRRLGARVRAAMLVVDPGGGRTNRGRERSLLR